MKNLRLHCLALLCLILSPSLYSQNRYQPTAENIAYRNHFRDMKFGLFIHWGIYSLLGDGEWVMFQQKIPYAKYSQLANAFYPHDFDAEAWVKMAKAAGMKYITITSRHHDGFSMFDTKATTYDIMDATPYKKDVIAAMAAACRKHDIKLHLYYSLLDWGREDYGFGQKIVDGKPEKADWDSYIRFMKTQLTELLTNYGDIVQAIWFDGDWERKKANWHYDEIYGLIHRLRPDVLIGNNHHEDTKPGEDFMMFEKDLPGGNSHGWGAGTIDYSMPLETCETINHSWGYNINDNSYKTLPQLLQYLVKAACQDANFLLNVGPRPDGTIQPEFADTLSAMGDWLAKNGETIYGTRGNIIPAQTWGGVTRKGDTHYVHILKQPDAPYVFLPGVQAGKIKATDRATGKTLKTSQAPEGLFVYHSYPTPAPVDYIITLEPAR